MTDYISNITTSDGTYPVGGDNFDGKWVYKYSLIYDGFPSFDSSYTFDLSSYLPNDNYDYEILLMGYGYTGTTNGNIIQIKVNSGSTATHDSSCLLSRAITRTSGFREHGSSAIIPVKNNDKKVSIFFNGTFSQSGNKSSVFVYGYRRVGTNGYANNPISNIEIMNNGTQTNIPIGGDMFSGQWISISPTVLYNTNYSANTRYTTNLKTSNILPNDNYEYEIILVTNATTGTSSGQWVIVGANTSIITSDINILACNTRTNSENERYQASVIPVGSNGSISFYINAPSGVSKNFRIRITGYRRIGTNN